MSQTVALSRETVAAVDPTGQMQDIITVPDQLRDALWRAESANVDAQETPGGLVVAGMGGSAIGGSLAAAVLGDRASRPIVIARDYALPPWTTPDTTVLCASYSGGTEEALPKALARGLIGSVPLVFGAGLTSPIAYRWKTQINENAKLPAFANQLPELDHNEICAWEGPEELGPFSAVFLDDSDLHPRVRQRLELTRGWASSRGMSTYRVETIGETRMERLVSLVLLGDFVSVYLAVLRGVDPRAIYAIERLKDALAGG